MTLWSFLLWSVSTWALVLLATAPLVRWARAEDEPAARSAVVQGSSVAAFAVGVGSVLYVRDGVLRGQRETGIDYISLTLVLVLAGYALFLATLPFGPMSGVGRKGAESARRVDAAYLLKWIAAGIGVVALSVPWIAGLLR